MSWQGQGAEAFKGQVQRIRDFDEQQANLIVALGLAMVAGRDAVQAARAGFVAVCDDAIAAAHAYREAEAAREERVGLYIAVGIAAVLLAVVTAGAGPGGVGLAAYALSGVGGGGVAVNQAITTGNTVYLTSIPSPDLDAVTIGLVERLDRVIGVLDEEMNTIAERCAAFEVQYGAGSNLLLPLPPSTDVRAPGYTYDDLRSEDRAPSPDFDAAIRSAAQNATPTGPITQALHPDG